MRPLTAAAAAMGLPPRSERFVMWVHRIRKGLVSIPGPDESDGHAYDQGGRGLPARIIERSSKSAVGAFPMAATAPSR
jgi:hypothetical protein